MNVGTVELYPVIEMNFLIRPQNIIGNSAREHITIDALDFYPYKRSDDIRTSSETLPVCTLPSLLFSTNRTDTSAVSPGSNSGQSKKWNISGY